MTTIICKIYAISIVTNYIIWKCVLGETFDQIQPPLCPSIFVLSVGTTLHKVGNHIVKKTRIDSASETLLYSDNEYIEQMTM